MIQVIGQLRTFFRNVIHKEAAQYFHACRIDVGKSRPSNMGFECGSDALLKPQQNSWYKLRVGYSVLRLPAVLTGITIGLFRGSRTSSLRFLAENAHRAPRTVRGWYLYNKTKNYRVVLGGLKGAGADATRLGLTAAGWVGIEEGCSWLGLDDVREVAAGFGTGALFGVVCECLLDAGAAMGMLCA